MKRAVGMVCLLMLCAVAHGGALTRITATFPEVPPPPQGSVQWVAKSMRMNGVPMTVRALHSKLSPSAVLHFYESWSKQQMSAQTVRSRVDGDEMLTIKTGPHLISIRAQRSLTATHGTITSSLASFANTSRVSTAFPTPSNVRLVNAQQYDDEGSEAEHLSFISTRAPHIESAALARHLEEEGWTILWHRAMREAVRGYTVESQKGAQHAQLTVLPAEGFSSGSRILVVWKKS